MKLVERAREYFGLQRRLREAELLPAARRARVYEQFDAAERRLSAARVLFEAGMFHDALALFHAAGSRLLRGHAWRTELEVDVEALSDAEAFERFSARVSGDVADDSVLARGVAQLGGFDVESVDRLTRGEARQRCEELDTATRWLWARVEPQSPRQVRQVRIWRLAIAALALLALPVGRELWLLSPRNLSRGQPVTASSVAQGSPAALVDDFSYGPPSFVSKEEEAWVTIDLGKRMLVSDAQVFGRHDCCFDQALPLAFELSVDGKRFETVATKTDPFVSLLPWVVKSVSAPARYVRLRTQRSTTLALTEIVVYGRRLR